MSRNLQAKDIKLRFDSLIVEAETVNPALATRLRQIKTWIKNTKPGSLTKKRELMLFLIELINDVEIWLTLNDSDPEIREIVLQELNSTERYWFTILFPKWLNTYNPKFIIWKQKLMKGEFEAKDRQMLNLLSQQVKRRGSFILQRYIIDFSMATDVIIGNSSKQVLCVQLTITNQNLLDSKKDDWLKTLQRWGIQRALFLSYNPINQNKSGLKVIEEVCNYILAQSYTLEDTCYSIGSID